MQKQSFTEKVARGAGRAAGRAAGKVAEKATTPLLVAEGKRSLKAKMHTVTKVTKKALKTGLIAGSLVAAAVVRHEVRKRRKLAK
jgi:hypothetical protein